jgi:hypothetical protein
MVLWYVTAGADWDDIGRLSQGWGNAHEIALARHFVAFLDKAADAGTPLDAGVLYWDVKTEGESASKLADALRTFWQKYPVLGLRAKETVPERPGGPSLACRLTISDTSVTIRLSASHPSGSDWDPVGEFRVKRGDRVETPAARPKDAPALTEPEREAVRVGDAIAEGLVRRLVHVKLARGPRVNGKPSYRIKIVNESPLILNGLALGSAEVGPENPPSVLSGMCLPPLKSLTVPASEDVVKRLHLKEETRALAADLTGL